MAALDEERVAAIFGTGAGFLTSALIALLVVGTLNTTILAGSRIPLAVARDDVFSAQSLRSAKRVAWWVVAGAPYSALQHVPSPLRSWGTMRW